MRKKIPTVHERRIGVLFIIPRLAGFGGSETYLSRVVRHLDRKRFNPFVMHFKSAGFGYKGPSAEVARMVNSEVKYIDLKRIVSWTALNALFEIRSYIKEKEIDIVQTFHPMGDFYGTIAAKLSGLSRIVSNRRDMGFNKSYKMIIAQRPVNRLVSNFVVPSEAVKKKIISSERICPSKISVIRNGVDLNVFRVKSSSKKALHQIGVEPNEFVVGIVANLYPIKGVEYFIRSIPLIKRRIENVKFIIVGGGSLRAELEEMAQRIQVRESVIFTGNRSDIVPILTCFDVFVNSSLSEGSSNAIIEAMACRLPVVATNVGGNPELIAHGESGLLVPAKDEHSMAEAIIRILNDEPLRLKMGTAARSFAERNHDLSTMMRALEELYIGIMSC